MNLDDKMKKLNKYNSEEFCAYQDGYYDGQKSGINVGMARLKELLIQHYHELPTTLGYTEQLIDFCIQSVMEEYNTTKIT